MASLHRRRHVVRDARRADDPVLHLLLDVRLPADRRPGLGVRGPARARVHDRRHRRPDDADRRGPPARRRPQPHPRLDRARGPRLRPGVRLRAGRRSCATASSGCTTTARTSSTTSPSTTRTTPSPPKPDGVDEGIVRGPLPLRGRRPDVAGAKGRVRLVGCGLDPAAGARRARPAGERARRSPPRSTRRPRSSSSATRRSRSSAGTASTRTRARGSRTSAQVLGQDGGPIVVATDWVQDAAGPRRAVGPGARTSCSARTASGGATRARTCAPTSRSTRPHIAAAAIAGLARCGELEPTAAAKQIRELGLDPETPDPLTRLTGLPDGRHRRGDACGPRAPRRERPRGLRGLAAPRPDARSAGPSRTSATSGGAFVTGAGWLDDATFAELVALCQTLPGPASSQLTIAIGRLRAGWSGALAAWLGFTLPSALLMTLLGLVAANAAAAADRAGGGRDRTGSRSAAVAIVDPGAAHDGPALAPDAAAARCSRPRRRRSCCSRPVAARSRSRVIVVGALVGRLVLEGRVGGAGDAGRPPDARPRAGRHGSSFRGPRPGDRVPGRSWPASQVLAAATGAPGPRASSRRSSARAPWCSAAGTWSCRCSTRASFGPGWVTRGAFLAGYGAAQALPGPLFSFAGYLGAVARGRPGRRARRASSRWSRSSCRACLLVLAALPLIGWLRGRPAVAASLAGRQRGRRGHPRRRADHAGHDGRADVARRRSSWRRRAWRCCSSPGCRRSSSSRPAPARWRSSARPPGPTKNAARSGRGPDRAA